MIGALEVMLVNVHPHLYAWLLNGIVNDFIAGKDGVSLLVVREDDVEVIEEWVMELSTALLLVMVMFVLEVVHDQRSVQ